MISKKVILCGSFGVGKTSLFNRFINNQFDDRYLTTIGVKVNKKSIEVEGNEVSLLLWDVAGEVSMEKVPTSYFLGASGVIYVFDLTRPMTFMNIASDLEYLRKMLPNAVIKLVGNKIDLLQPPQVEEIKQQLTVEWDILTSAKTGENVIELFTSLATQILQ